MLKLYLKIALWHLFLYITSQRSSHSDLVVVPKSRQNSEQKGSPVSTNWEKTRIFESGRVLISLIRKVPHFCRLYWLRNGQERSSERTGRFFFVTAARKSHTARGARSRCVFDRLSDRRGHSTFQLRNKYRRREIGEEGTGKKTSSKEPFSIGNLDFDRRNVSHSREHPGRSGNNATYEPMKRVIDQTTNRCMEPKIF